MFRHAAPIAVVTVLLVGLYWSTELLPGPWVQAANPAQSPQLVASLAPSAGRVPEPQGGKTGHGPNVTATPQPAAHNVELIGHVEGDAYSVAVRGNTAYVGMRLSVPRFVVLDVSEHNQPHTLGVLPSMKDDVWGINVVSPYAYLANRSAGLWLVDVSNPNVPLAKATYTPPDYAWDVFVTGGYAYVAAGVSGGLRVVDVSTPWAPRQVGVNNTPGGDARDVAISGNYAYVADWDQGLRVVDVSTPRAPQEVGVYDTQGYAAGVFVAGGYAYVADRDQGLRVVDVANPRVPQEVGAYNTQGNAAGVFVAAGYAYIADSDDGLRVVDVANPRAPREVGFYDPRQGTAVGVFVAGDYVYLADRSGGLLILRFIAPPTPTGTPTSTPTSTLSPTPTDTPTPTPCPDSFEPDDQWFQAKVLSIETPQRHTFHVPGDVDWVKFVAQAGYHYTIRTLGLAPHVDTVLCLYGTNGQELLVPCNDDDPTNPPASRIDWDCQADGTYFVKTNNLDPQVGGCNLAYSIEIVGAMITPTPTVTASATRTSTLIPTATATATPTATHTATPTPISTGTSTSAPTLTPSATPTSILTLTPCPDSFEPDDQWFRAGVLIVGNPPQHHTLHVAGDVDWVKFVAQVGYHYIIRTLELAPGVDTLLCLYDVDGQALVSCNDDDPTNPPASQIDWTCQADGTYFVNVSNLDPQAGGCDLRYSIEVTEATITPTPTATPRSGRAYLPIIRRDLTPTPTPIPTPLICNGRFEVGHLEPCWQEGGELGRWVVDRLDVGEPTPTFEGAYAGNYSALLGDPGLGPGLPGQRGIPVGSAWIEQAIVVPNTAAPRLSFRYRIMTYDVAQDAKGRWYDIFEVQINGEQVFWDGNKVPGTSQQRHDLNWRLGEVDLSRWRGRTVIVRFANWNGYGSGPGSELYDTWTYLDEVQVEP